MQLVIPGLLWLNNKYIYKNLKLDNINKIIKHANIELINLSYSDLFYANIFQKSNNFSVAQAYKAQYSIANEYSHYLVAEPTHLQTEGNNLLITDKLVLTEVEAHVYINEINSYFNNEVKIYFIKTNLWLIGINIDIENNKFYPLIDIVGKSVSNYLSNSVLINRLINEIQMLLFNLESNKSGKYPLNNLWLWDKIIEIDKVYLNNLTFIDDLYLAERSQDTNLWLENIAKINEKLNYMPESILIPLLDRTIKISVNQYSKYKFWKNNTLLKIVENLISQGVVNEI